jgi:ribosomal RNA assembly protein
MEFSYDLKMPKSRIGVIVGKKGCIKRLLERKLNVSISIDSHEGIVYITSYDSLKLMIAKDVVKAISRGFNPDVALNLLNDDYSFDVVNIPDVIGNSKSRLLIVKSRLIGTDGKARRNVERLTGVDIVVYGKTVALIGSTEKVAIARRAVEGLLMGRKHATVYKWLENKRKSFD